MPVIDGVLILELAETVATLMLDGISLTIKRSVLKNRTSMLLVPLGGASLKVNVVPETLRVSNA
jgi:riboflavin synthase alpha subunit